MRRIAECAESAEPQEHEGRISRRDEERTDDHEIHDPRGDKGSDSLSRCHWSQNQCRALPAVKKIVASMPTAPTDQNIVFIVARSPATLT